MSALSPDIVVEELQPEGRRYVLPRREMKALRWLALVPIVFGLLSMLWMFGFVGGMVRAFVGGPPWLAIIAGLFAAPMCLPIFIGLGALFGHSEVEVHSDTLRTIERVGMLRWMRTRRVDQVQRLRVEGASVGDRRQPRRAVSDSELAAIRIEWGGPRPWLAAIGYPRAMLLPLATELADRCRIAPPAPGFADDPQTLPPVEVINDESNADWSNSEIGERHDQPTDSKIIVDKQPGSVTFNVPAAGLVRGSSGLFVFACLWCGFMALVTGLVFIAGGPQQQGIGALLGAAAFIGLFWLVGIGLMLGAVNSGVRRAGIAVTGDQLAILKTGIFGSKSHTWSRDQVMSVRVGPSGVEVNDRPVMELQVLGRDGDKFGLLGGRDVEELAWLATSIREALGVTTSASVLNELLVLPDAPTQPATSRIAFSQVPGGLTVSVPPLGLGRSTIGLWIVAVIWVVGVANFTFFFVRDIDHWFDSLFPLGIATFFEAGGVALLAVALHWTIRRVEIAVAGGSLLILQTGVTGKKHYEWRSDELLAVRAGASGAETNGKPMIELQIVPRLGNQVAFLMGRENGELAWIATLLRNALNLPAEVPDETLSSPADVVTEEANT